MYIIILYSIVSLGFLYETFVLFMKRVEGLSPLLLKSGGAIAPLAPPIATPMSTSVNCNALQLYTNYFSPLYS